jgi:hypothetical protein
MVRSAIGTLAFAVAGTVAVGAHISTQETSRIQDSAAVLSEIHGQPDKDIPQDANRDLYGRTRVARQALTDGTKALAVTQPFMIALQREYANALR